MHLGLPQKMQEELAHMREEPSPSPKDHVPDPFDFLHTACDNSNDNAGADENGGNGAEQTTDARIVHDIGEWMQSVREGRY